MPVLRPTAEPPQSGHEPSQPTGPIAGSNRPTSGADHQAARTTGSGHRDHGFVMVESGRGVQRCHRRSDSPNRLGELFFRQHVRQS